MSISSPSKQLPSNKQTILLQEETDLYHLHICNLLEPPSLNGFCKSQQGWATQISGRILFYRNEAATEKAWLCGSSWWHLLREKYLPYVDSCTFLAEEAKPCLHLSGIKPHFISQMLLVCISCSLWVRTLPNTSRAHLTN